MKSRLLRGVALPVLLASPAMAADLPVKAPPAPAPLPAISNWTGFYVGLNAGGAWAKTDPTTSASCVPALGFPMPYLACPDAVKASAIATGSISSSAFIGGGQLGYNWQANNTVLGVEVDFNSFHLRVSRQGTTNFTQASGSTFTITNAVSTDWLFTARGRLGWAFNTVLAYATGGLALTDLKNSNTYLDPGINSSWSSSTTKVGWTVGGGLEWALNRNWSVKAEYLYVKFASVNASGFLVSATPCPAMPMQSARRLT